MPSLLDVQGLSLDYLTEGGVIRALDTVDLAIAPGEIVGLVGESGCGKSSLARTILGTLPAGQATRVEGDIRFNGLDMLRDRKAARSLCGQAVTFIPQDPFSSFNPLFRIGTQVTDLMRRKALQKEALLSLLDAVQLPDPNTILDKYPHQLSGGQRQRFMIAMALLPQPDLIIADEPTTALDVTIQAQILGLIRRLAAEQGASVLYITHDLGTAWEICDRVVVMYAGQIIESAPRETFFSRPLHPYTRMLLACLPEPGRKPAGIPGDLPDPLSPPQGCRFSPRCPRSSQVCQEAPSLILSADTAHLVACHHPYTDAGSMLHG